MLIDNFSLPDKNGKTVSLSDFKNKWIVLYFYPKDNTPGCTLEAVEFSNKLSELNCSVIAISPDSSRSHCKFSEKYNLKLTLLSDESKEVLKKFKVWKEKSRFGKKYMGVVRTTLLIDPSQKIVFRWDSVEVIGHVKKVIEKLNELR